MKRIILVILLGFSFNAFAEDFADLKKKIIQARQTLLVLINDKAQRGIEQQKEVKDSINDVWKALCDIKVPVSKEKKLNELKIIWKEFKETRENDIVPALLAGKEDIANKLAMGIQKNRLDKMLAIVKELEGTTHH